MSSVIERLFSALQSDEPVPSVDDVSYGIPIPHRHAELVKSKVFRVAQPDAVGDVERHGEESGEVAYPGITIVRQLLDATGQPQVAASSDQPMINVGRKVVSGGNNTISMITSVMTKANGHTSTA